MVKKACVEIDDLVEGENDWVFISSECCSSSVLGCTVEDLQRCSYGAVCLKRDGAADVSFVGYPYFLASFVTREEAERVWLERVATPSDYFRNLPLVIVLAREADSIVGGAGKELAFIDREMSGGTVDEAGAVHDIGRLRRDLVWAEAASAKNVVAN